MWTVLTRPSRGLHLDDSGVTVLLDWRGAGQWPAACLLLAHPHRIAPCRTSPVAWLATAGAAASTSVALLSFVEGFDPVSPPHLG
ncbi:hypothetical protein GCM10022267_83790 [Lentzea roselyniae]|uniref:Alpha/beta hydrolase n=1 Tax=Lentzea roselyniae TaxID=531940 RepID=A0ABP7C9L4_9PSEU